MDKLREEFERWAANDRSELEVWKRGPNAGEYKNPVVSKLWKAWQASRASIVVDTPPLCGDGENDTEYTEGYNDGITATEKTIRSIGLSIKGE